MSACAPTREGEWHGPDARTRPEPDVVACVQAGAEGYAGRRPRIARWHPRRPPSVPTSSSRWRLTRTCRTCRRTYRRKPTCPTRTSRCRASAAARRCSRTPRRSGCPCRTCCSRWCSTCRRPRSSSRSRSNRMRPEADRSDRSTTVCCSSACPPRACPSRRWRRRRCRPPGRTPPFGTVGRLRRPRCRDPTDRTSRHTGERRKRRHRNRSPHRTLGNRSCRLRHLPRHPPSRPSRCRQPAMRRRPRRSVRKRLNGAAQRHRGRPSRARSSQRPTVPLRHQVCSRSVRIARKILDNQHSGCRPSHPPSPSSRLHRAALTIAVPSSHQLKTSKRAAV